LYYQKLKEEIEKAKENKRNKIKETNIKESNELSDN
jgi:hypothetical protein